MCKPKELKTKSILCHQCICDAKYIIHEYYVCGRHLTNIIKVLAPLNGNNVTVEVIK